MSYFKIMTSILLILSSFNALSSENERAPWLVGIAGNVSINSEDNTNEYIGSEFYIGYQFNSIFSAELDYGYYGKRDDASSSFGPSLMLKAGLPLSEKAVLQFGLGEYYDQNNLNHAASLGITYKTSPSLLFDVTYKAMLNAYNASNDLYSLRLGLTYVFDSEVSLPITKTPIIRPKQKTHIKKMNILNTKKQYIVKQHEYFYQIARQLGMDVLDLISLNPAYACCGRDLDLIHPGDKLNLR